ncbi:3-hydroxyacyl-CoA dehydrogenase NAD-binding domain-containing protein [Craterilacuibacter sinensis]|uniref:3-hydroxyacyl-CoA dehydrogenase n=1 Tax=Craterilacuibacter sinensis TaxID=2686017 RepID=A0A845BMI8_9NEIS|nr:3-hydroxyacyl-CoA dehydrogenase NAD-binding domain-containing protein [Craterilacuibacter sinensis]MXR37469.1 3-hydroxyacyl-CoA dehydrogenase [Craterilacuibacter sinensis]
MIDYFKSELAGNGILTLTIDQPDSQANVMDRHFIDSLRHHVDAALADPAVKGVLLTSAKSSFVAGADLKALEASLSETPDAAKLYSECRAFSALLRKIETGGKPFACALNGAALGGGFEIALACHYRCAADVKGMMVGLPEVGVGLLPGAGGTQRYLRMLGVARALPLLLQGSQIKPAKALEMGLIDALVPAEALLDCARTWLTGSPDASKPWDRKGFRIPGGQNPLEPAIAQLFLGSNASVQANTCHNLPAPQAILSCLYEGMQLPMDKALDIECKYFVRLNLDPVAGNMIRTLFINKGKADRLMHRPDSIARHKHQTIGVLGAGLMGAGLALVAAQAGIAVVLIDRDQAAADKGKDYARTRLARDVEKGRTTQDKMDAILSRITATSDYALLQDASLVIEAVFEDRAVKAEVFARAEAALSASAILASNTSALPITGLAATLGRPGNFIGLHFFSPVERMPLVEVIKGHETSEHALALALDFVGQLKKTPILVNDSPGFFTSRFFGAFLNEGITMVAEGISPVLIEQAAHLAGYPVGPLAVADEVGLDLAHKGAQQRRQDEGDNYHPGSSVPVIAELVVKHGRHGRKNGMGFYEYGDSGKQLWSGLAAIWPQKTEQPDVEQVKARLLYAQLADAARTMADGVLFDAADGDVGACLGVGFPAYLGGPFSTMDTLGLAQVIARCELLAREVSAERFAIPELLRDMAKNGQRFYGKNALVAPASRKGEAA